MPDSNGFLKGFDTAVGSAALISAVDQIKAKGFEFYAGYYGSGGKVLTKQAAQVLLNAGLVLTVFYENMPLTADGSFFNEARGVVDGMAALKQAQALGQTERTAIYATVDMDLSFPTVEAYLRGFNAALQNKYIMGVYGNGDVCSGAFDSMLTSLTCIWGAIRTRGTAEFIASGRWSLKQLATQKAASAGLPFDIDPEVGRGGVGFGEFKSLVGAETLFQTKEIPSASVMQIALGAAGLYTGRIDGDFGPLSYAALRKYYLRQKGN